MVIEHKVILQVVEEMLGVAGGGQNLGDALEQWLSLPPENRKSVQFADLKAKGDAQKDDIRS